MLQSYIMKYARSYKTISLPSPLYDAVMREVYETKESFSWIVTKRLCAAYNLNIDHFENTKRKPSEVIATPLAEVQALQTALPHPQRLADLLNYPNRSRNLYNLLISDGGYYRWAPCPERDKYTAFEASMGRPLKWEGECAVIPEEDKPFIRSLMEKHAY